jgi:hypothetical protein
VVGGHANRWTKGGGATLDGHSVRPACKMKVLLSGEGNPSLVPGAGMRNLRLLGHKSFFFMGGAPLLSNVISSLRGSLVPASTKMSCKYCL